MKRQLKNKAVRLRKKGKSYGEIITQVPVSRSTLSLWLRDVQLSSMQRRHLVLKREKAALRGALKRKRERIQKTNTIFKTAKKEIGNVSERDLFLTGIALYWAEGMKQKKQNVSQRVVFTNSHAPMVKIFLLWLVRICNITKEDIRFELYIHKNSNKDKAIEYWKKELNIDTIAVRLKKHTVKTIRYNTGEDYNGLVRMTVCKSTDFNRKITGWINGVIEAWGVV